MAYRMNDSVDIEKIKDLIVKNTHIDKDAIKMSIENDQRLRIEYDYISVEALMELSEIISDAFSDSLSIVAIGSTGSVEAANHSSRFMKFYMISASTPFIFLRWIFNVLHIRSGEAQS